MLNEYLFARELGNPVARQLELYVHNKLWHSLSRDSNTTFQATELEKGVNCLDIERQQKRYLLSGQANGSVCLWDLDQTTSTDVNDDFIEESDENFLSPTATVTASKATHTHSLTSILYYPIDAGMFLTTAFDRRLLVWDTSTLEPAFCTTFSHAPASISISPVGHNTLVAVASPGPEVRLVDLASGSSVRSLGTGATASVRWSERDGWLLMTGSIDGEVGIWDVRMARGCLGMLGERRGKVTRGHEGAVNGITFSEDGRYVVTSGRDNKIKVWDLATGEDTLITYPPLHRPHRILSSNPILTPHITSDPQLLFVPSIDEVIGFDFLRGDVLVKSRAVTQKDKINALIVRPSYHELYFGSSSGEIGIMKAPEMTVDEEDDEEKDENVLNKIYKSLVQEPITFN